MKKLFFTLLAMGCLMAFSQQATLTLPVDGGYVATDQVIVPITVSALGGGTGGVSGFLYAVYFDENVLTLEGSQNLHPNANATFFSENLLLPGEWRGNWLDFINLTSFTVSEDDVMIELVFTYNGPGGSDLTWSTSKAVSEGFALKIATEMTDENFTNYALTLGDGSINLVSLANTWQGDDVTLPDDWFTAANWSDNVVPGSGDDAFIPSSAAAYPYITGNGNEGMVNNLEVEAGVVLSVGVQAGLTVSGNLLCDGTLSLETDATGNSGSFICDGAISGAGFFEMFRDVVCYGNGEPEGDWHYLSSPVDGFTNYSMYDYFVNTWDQAGGVWQHLMGDPTIPCDPAPETALVYDATHLDAFAMNWDENYLPDCNTAYPGTGNMINFYGPITDLHNGSYSAAAGFGALSYQEWNMFGNPYPSSIDITAVTWGAGVVEGAALWDACADNYIYINTTTNPGFIPPTNGFFIQTTVASTFSLDGSERAHDGTTTFYKDDQSGLLILEASGIGGSDKLYVHFMEGVTGGFDTQGDFHKLISTAQGLPQIYTTISQEKLAINARPEIDMLPMGFQSVSTGNYTIAAVETSEFTEIYLEDLVTGTITNLMTSDYSFDYTEGEASNRFMIHFGPLGVDDNSLGNISIWSSENKVYVELPKEISGEITILNMMGQEVMSTDTQPGINVIPLSEVNTYYVVKVVSNKQVITGKVYIK